MGRGCRRGAGGDEQCERALTRLNDLVAENQESIHTTVTNVEQVTSMLAAKKDEIALAISDVKDGADNFKTLSSKLEVSLGDNMDGLTRQAKDSLQQFSAAWVRTPHCRYVEPDLEKLEVIQKAFCLVETDPGIYSAGSITHPPS